MTDSNVIIAGGLLTDIKSSYFRVGHMGSVSANDLLAVLGALERALSELGQPFEIGKVCKLSNGALKANL
jgi:alanine-glyoxylate transaminase/serine-glyoxylate transaminase/serine-pyruvate transaminase